MGMIWPKKLANLVVCFAHEDADETLAHSFKVTISGAVAGLFPVAIQQTQLQLSDRHTLRRASSTIYVAVQLRRGFAAVVI